MVKVLIKKLFPGVQLPSYKTSGASGMDLMAFVKSSITIKPKLLKGKKRLDRVPTTIIDLPWWQQCQIIFF